MSVEKIKPLPVIKYAETSILDAKWEIVLAKI
jgi:hypothetical protein